jgi:predicted ArsR family transcriptional regulator
MPRNSKRPQQVTGVLGEARGRLLSELCGRPQTAVELAERVGTSSNAVRVHLNGLRSAGLVDYQVHRRGVGKPTHVYSLTAAAEYLLSSAYAPVLRSLIETLQSRLGADVLPRLRDAGVTLAARYGSSSTRRGIDSATVLLDALGAKPTVETRGKQRWIRTACCPLAAVTRDTAGVCQLIEQALTTASGLSIREHCDRGEHPRCSFEVGSRSSLVSSSAEPLSS